MRLRDAFGPLFSDEDVADLFPAIGQPALAPWRLALVTMFQFSENLTDRQAADAVRGRVDWKYALGLELEDPGFDFSVLIEFRDRLVAGGSEQLLLDKLLECFKASGLIKERGKQRTDSTCVLADVRVMNRAELVGETLRAALNQLAAVDPGWLRGFAQPEWFERYSHRSKNTGCPNPKRVETLTCSLWEETVSLYWTRWMRRAQKSLRDSTRFERSERSGAGIPSAKGGVCAGVRVSS